MNKDEIIDIVLEVVADWSAVSVVAGFILFVAVMVYGHP